MHTELNRTRVCHPTNDVHYFATIYSSAHVNYICNRVIIYTEVVVKKKKNNNKFDELHNIISCVSQPFGGVCRMYGNRDPGERTACTVVPPSKYYQSPKVPLPYTWKIANLSKVALLESVHPEGFWAYGPVIFKALEYSNKLSVNI